MGIDWLIDRWTDGLMATKKDADGIEPPALQTLLIAQLAILLLIVWF